VLAAYHTLIHNIREMQRVLERVRNSSIHLALNDLPAELLDNDPGGPMEPGNLRTVPEVRAGTRTMQEIVSRLQGWHSILASAKSVDSADAPTINRRLIFAQAKRIEALEATVLALTAAKKKRR